METWSIAKQIGIFFANCGSYNDADRVSSELDGAQCSRDHQFLSCIPCNLCGYMAYHVPDLAEKDPEAE